MVCVYGGTADIEYTIRQIRHVITSGSFEREYPPVLPIFENEKFEVPINIGRTSQVLDRRPVNAPIAGRNY